MLVLKRVDGSVTHHRFPELPGFLLPGDVLVLNDSRVIPARLRGTKLQTGGQIEILLVEENTPNDWWAMLRPGKRVRAGSEFQFTNKGKGVRATVLEKNAEGLCRLQFHDTHDIAGELETLGEVPLPPYISRETLLAGIDDRRRYQTVYARSAGSVAAPTAGLHFTEASLDRIRSLGVRVCFVTLHVGLGTFAPIKAGNLEEHVIHEERFRIDGDVAEAINQARRSKRRVIAVGTTTVRVLETVAAQNRGLLAASEGRTRIFIHPPCEFRIVDGLLTNFHLPQSTLLMLVSAFAAPGETRGREMLLAAYDEAIRERYRFYSYGDVMLIL
jgi:S-adenosylmethionine:tRNA ribosyltransferase-isomerase